MLRAEFRVLVVAIWSVNWTPEGAEYSCSQSKLGWDCEVAIAKDRLMKFPDLTTTGPAMSDLQIVEDQDLPGPKPNRRFNGVQIQPSLREELGLLVLARKLQTAEKRRIGSDAWQRWCGVIGRIYQSPEYPLGVAVSWRPTSVTPAILSKALDERPFIGPSSLPKEPLKGDDSGRRLGGMRDIRHSQARVVSEISVPAGLEWQTEVEVQNLKVPVRGRALRDRELTDQPEFRRRLTPRLRGGGPSTDRKDLCSSGWRGAEAAFYQRVAGTCQYRRIVDWRRGLGPGAATRVGHPTILLTPKMMLLRCTACSFSQRIPRRGSRAQLPTAPVTEPPRVVADHSSSR